MKSFCSKRYDKIVTKYCENFNINKNIIYAIIKSESNFFPYAKSQAGAYGLMQIMPITWNHAKEVLGFNSDDYYNKNTNIMVGTWYISYLCKYYNGNEKYAILAYNAGLDNVNKWIQMGYLRDEDHKNWEIPFSETKHYLDTVMENYEKFVLISDKI